jgi:threonine synthase
MDVGDPSNFVRIRHLYGDKFETLEKNLYSFAFTDRQTKEAISEIYKRSGYIADPHGAVGYLGLKKYRESHPDGYGIFLETAHPVKFLSVVEKTIGENVAIPTRIQALMEKDKKSLAISSYGDLKKYLLET